MSMRFAGSLVFIVFILITYSCEEKDLSHQKYRVSSSPRIDSASIKDSLNNFFDIVHDVRGKNIFVFNIHPKLPDFKFILIGDSSSNTIQEINIYRANDSSFIQNIPITTFIEAALKDEKYFYVADFNFDGFKDIALNTWSGSAGRGYTIWLYNSYVKKFKTIKFFEDIHNPTIDTAKKCITTISPYGSQRIEYYTRTYKYSLGKFLLIKEKKNWIKYGTRGYDIMEDTRKLQNDTMRLVSRKRKETYMYK